MVGYVTVGTADLDRAVKYFDTLLGEFGGKQLMNLGRMVMYGKDMGNGMLAVCVPFDKQDPSVGNGSMVALNVENQENVRKMHARALELGGTDEGAPGERMPGFYGGYFRDLDGNKFCAFCLG